MRNISIGHAVFAVVMIALGIVGLIRSEFAAIWNGLPKGMPGHEALVSLCSVVALACGIGLLWPRTTVLAARVLLVWLVVWTLLVKARFIVFHPLVEGAYQTNGENAVVIAGAWVLFARFATDWDRRWLGFATGDNGIRIARVLYGLALIAFGFSHFFYLNLTTPLIPSWLPGHVFWAYFTGSAYLAAGAAVLIGLYARLAAVLSTAQMGSFIFLVWLPIALAGKMTPFNWGELVATCVLTAGAWVVAESYRGIPWLAVRIPRMVFNANAETKPQS
jgi:uncharacterized membrane protein YphA (DoxX/SURF4 family)